MSISIEALKEAIQIKETIQNLEDRLRHIFGGKPVSLSLKRGRPAKVADVSPAPAKGRKKRKLSAAGRARIVAALKKRWAKQKGGQAAAPAKVAKKRRKLSAEGRARIIAAQKKRWATQKKSK